MAGGADPTAMNITNYYKPTGYQTGTKMRPNTQDGGTNKSPIPSGEGLADGNLLSNIDCISNDELKERLVVAEMIMKKLYSRNKDLEIAINKVKIKSKNLKQSTGYPNTAQNFFKNSITEIDEPTSKVDNKNQNLEEIDIEDINDSQENSDVEIGCKECEKYRENEKKD